MDSHAINTTHGDSSKHSHPQILHLEPNSLWGLEISMHFICPFGPCVLMEKILLWPDCLSLCRDQPQNPIPPRRRDYAHSRPHREGAGGLLSSRWDHHSTRQTPDQILNSLPHLVPSMSFHLVGALGAYRSNDSCALALENPHRLTFRNLALYKNLLEFLGDESIWEFLEIGKTGVQG